LWRWQVLCLVDEVDEEVVVGDGSTMSDLANWMASLGGVDAGVGIAVSTASRFEKVKIVRIGDCYAFIVTKVGTLEAFGALRLFFRRPESIVSVC
jgi:hypothetical protein